MNEFETTELTDVDVYVERTNKSIEHDSDPKNDLTIKNILIRGSRNGLIFTTLWASWAYYVNSSSGAELAMKAAITQGCFTMINGFIYSVLMEYLFSLGKNSVSRIFLGFVVPNALLTVILITVHIIRGTPEIAMTVIPSLSTVYVLSMVYVTVLGPKALESIVEKK